MTATVTALAPLPADPAAARWLTRSPFGARTVAIVLAVLLLLGWSGDRVELGKLADEAHATVRGALGFTAPSQSSRAVGRVAGAMFPPVIAERTEIDRIEGFDPGALPWLAYVETERATDVRMNPETLRIEERSTERKVLVQPLGYLVQVLWKMLETFEIAIWGTMLGIVMALPLCYLAASNYTPGRLFYGAARALLAMLLAVPELISALFLVLAFGFGPVAGVLALAFHTTGFIGRFFATDIENADPKPQEALLALGASRPKVLIAAVLPQVAPQYVSYMLYILDRNVRAATVIGIVGAGGIGQELKGRYDLFDYGHVATILIAIFVTVLMLDQLAARIRRRLI